MVFVNDGSSDGTLGMLEAAAERDPRIVVVELSRNFGHQIALAAAIDQVSCGAGQAAIQCASARRRPWSRRGAGFPAAESPTAQIWPAEIQSGLRRFASWGRTARTRSGSDGHQARPPAAR